MHHVDRADAVEEVWQAMEQLVREGNLTYVAHSNFAAWDVAVAQSAASARHSLGLTSEQSLYNLAVRTVELELIPALRALGIGLLAYSRLHAGLLAGALEAGAEDERIEAHRDQLEAYEGLCRELDAKPAHVALASLLRNPSSPQRSSARGRARSCSRASARCRCPWTPMWWNDSITSGPGRRSPQAYAWHADSSYASTPRRQAS